MTQTYGELKEANELYEIDFHAWTQEQAHYLRSGMWNSLDIPNLIEEIESLGKQDRRELRNRLRILIAHLLKWEYQLSKRSRSWSNTIYEQRYQIQELLKESPSLKPYLHEAVGDVYRYAVDLAVRETSLDENLFPQECSYNLEQILNSKFFPGQHFEDDSNVD